MSIVCEHCGIKNVKFSHTVFDPDWLMEFVADYFKRPVEAIHSASEFKKDREVRFMVFYLLDKFCGIRPSVIAEKFHYGEVYVSRAFSYVREHMKTDTQYLEGALQNILDGVTT